MERETKKDHRLQAWTQRKLHNQQKLKAWLSREVV
jgi:hypothetical protein